MYLRKNYTQYDLAAAVEKRASFWRYPTDSVCTVTLRVGDKAHEFKRTFEPDGRPIYRRVG